MTRAWTAAELLEMTRGFQPACIVTAAADLDIFSAFGGESLPAATLATRIGAAERGTTILLDALAALGLLDKTDDVYRVAPGAADLFCADSPVNVLAAIRHQGNCLRRWAQLAQVVRSGQPAERVPSVRGAQADRESFIGAMNDFNVAMAPGIVARLESLAFQRMLDIGGASGTWTMAFLRAFPEATAVLFDLPEVIPLARDRLTAAGLLDRVTLVAGDYNVDPLPGGTDFVWLSAVVHQNSRAENQSLYRRIHEALTPGGCLVIRDLVMDSSRTRPASGALFAVNMLVATEGGNSYSLDEFQGDLTGAGFVQIEWIYQDEGMNSLIRAKKR